LIAFTEGMLLTENTFVFILCLQMNLTIFNITRGRKGREKENDMRGTEDMKNEIL
jgi:hypothetical protein